MSAAAHALPRGELVLDRYRPLRPLGSGGSGSVWLARDERNGLDVALKIVPREGKAGAPRRARGRSGLPAPARALPARVRLRLRLRPRLHRVRVRRRLHAARRDARRRAARRPGGRGGRPDARRARARAQPRDRASRRQAVERAARRRRRDLRAPARLRAGAVRRGRDADRGRGRPRHARLHLARAAARRGGVLGERRLGGRRHALGGAGRQASVLGRPAAADGRDDRGGRPPLQPERPDLPKRLLSAISHALAPDPARRPPAAALAKELRSALAGDKRSATVERVSPHALAERAAPAALAGVAALVGANGAPVLPHRLGGRSRRGDCLRRVPVTRAPGSRSRSPRRCCRSATTRSGWRSSTACSRSAGWHSTGGTRAGAWRSSPGLSLAAVGLLALVPLVHGRTRERRPPRLRRRSRRSWSRRVVAGLRGVELPFGQGIAQPLGLEGVESAFTAARVLIDAVPAGLALEALALAAVAVALPYARTPWRRRRARRGDARGHAPARSGRACASGRARRVAHGRRTGAQVRALDSCSGGMTPRPHERPPEHRAEDRRPLRGDVRARLPHARPAGRARAQAREGDGRAPDDLRLARLRPERVFGLPVRDRPRAVHRLRGLARRRAAGSPDRARAAGELRDADAAEGADADRRRPLDRRVRDRDAHGPAGGEARAAAGRARRRRSGRARR